MSMLYGFGDNTGNLAIIDTQKLPVLKCEWNLYLEVSGEKSRWLTPQELELVESISTQQIDSGSDTMTIRLKDPNMDFINKAIFVEEAKITFIEF